MDIIECIRGIYKIKKDNALYNKSYCVTIRINKELKIHMSEWGIFINEELYYPDEHFKLLNKYSNEIFLYYEELILKEI
jgi:hypothetical protein